MNGDTSSSTEPPAQPQSTPEPSSTTSLRQRGTTKKSTRRLSYVVNANNNEQQPSSQMMKSVSKKKKVLNDAQESVFLNMYIRKMHRRIRGKQSNNSLCCEFIVVIILLIAILIVGWDNHQGREWQEADTIGLVIILLWLIFALSVFFVYSKSPYAKMLRYMIIYIPLVFFVASISLYEEVRLAQGYGLIPQQYWLLALSIVLEVLVFIGFMMYYFGFPKIIKSDWFRSKPGIVQWLWNIDAIVENDAWTLSYRGHNPIRRGLTKCNMDYMCKYEGDIDEDTGLPDGLGRWLDDAYEGEMLTGYWKQGTPVAPFSSWNVASDDAVVAVRVAYFKATDDVFEKNKLKPTNDLPPECGVASVECSVSGSFYKHLPCATLIEGPYVTDSMPSPQNNPLRLVLSEMIHVGEVEDTSSVTIRLDNRGVNIPGYVYEKTGRSYHSHANSVTVDVEWGGSNTPQSQLSAQTSVRCLQKTLFMPRPASTPLSKLVEVEVEDSSEDENSDEDGKEIDNTLEKQRQQMLNSQQMQAGTLRVQSWMPVKYKEALIFLPGYNFSMNGALKTIGQFLAMTRLSAHVYPIVYVWPGSKNVGYAYASKVSATENNQLAMLKLIRGLKEAGINRVSFLTHSMGVQTLMNAFQDEYNSDGEYVSRSEVSKCFTLDPEFDDTAGPKEGKRQQFSHQLVCKSITLLNADFPVKAFVDRGFLSIRRLCHTITVVGDSNDRALWWSSIMNGYAPHFGYDEPKVLRPTITSAKSKPTKWEFMNRIGRSIEELYFPNGPYHAGGREEEFRRLLFNKNASIDLSGNTKYTNDRLWLDLDVIDMTGLDTNIKNQRHSGFSLNAMLLKDLHELISTGKRAMKRSSLLFREGNYFTFAHAPSFVSQ